MFRMYPNQIIASCFLFFGAWNSAIPIYGATESTHLHVVLIGDTEDEAIGESVNKDLINLRDTLAFGIPECRRTISVFSGEKATPANVQEYIRQLDVPPDTSLFVYYSGHGVVDPQSGHVLTMKRGNLIRKDLLDEIRLKKARLSILISDSCAIFSRITLRAAPAPGTWDKLRSLFFLHEGEVTINSARTGTYAFCDLRGGLFTRNFCSALRSPIAPQNPRSAITSWQEFLFEVNTDVKKDAERRVKSPWDVIDRGAHALSKSDIPVSFQEMEVFDHLATPCRTRMPQCGYPVGITIEKTGKEGVKITHVFDDSPAAWAGLLPGDQLLKMNEIAMDTPDDLVNAVATVSKSSKYGLSIAMKVVRPGHSTPIDAKLWLEEDTTLTRLKELLMELKHSRYEEAESIGRELVIKSPKSAVAHYNLAAALAGGNKADEAITQLNTAVALGAVEALWKDNENFATHILLSKHFASINNDSRFADVVDNCWSRLLVHVEPNEDTIARLATDAIKSDEPERALSLLHRAIAQGLDAEASIFNDPAWNPLKSDPRFQELRQQASRQTALLNDFCSAMRKNNYSDAVRIARVLVALNPLNARSHGLLAWVLSLENRVNEAYECLQTSVNLGDIEACWWNRRTNTVANGFNALKNDPRFAVILSASWNRLVALNESNPYALGNLATEALKMGESKMALHILEKAVSQGLDADSFPSNDPIWESLKSDPRFQQSQQKAAETSCRVAKDAVILNPTSYSFFNWAQCLARAGKSDDAIQKIAQAVNLGLDPKALSFKDDVWRSIRSDPRIPQLQRQAAEISCDAAAKEFTAYPKSPMSCYVWARCLARLGRYEEAIQKLELAVNLGYFLLDDALKEDEWQSIKSDPRIPKLQRKAAETRCEVAAKAAAAHANSSSAFLDWARALAILDRSEEAVQKLDLAVNYGLRLDGMSFEDDAWRSIKSNSRYQELQDKASRRISLQKEFQAAIERKDYRDAVQSAESLVAMTPGNAEARYNFAYALALEDKNEEAFKYLQESIDLGVVEDFWRTNHANLLALSVTKGGFKTIRDDRRFSASLAESWDRIVLLIGSDTVAIGNLATDAMKMGETTKALDILERAIGQGLNADALVFKNPDWKPLNSDSRFQQLQQKAAESSCNLAANVATVTPTSYAFHKWAGCLARLNKPEESIQKLTKAVNLGLGPDRLLLKDAVWNSIRSDPRIPQLREQAAKARCVAAAKAAAYDPKSPFALYNWARCLARLGDSPEALQRLQEAVELGWNLNLDMMRKDPAWSSIINDERLPSLLEKTKKPIRGEAASRIVPETPTIPTRDNMVSSSCSINHQPMELRTVIARIGALRTRRMHLPPMLEPFLKPLQPSRIGGQKPIYKWRISHFCRS